MNGTAPSGAGPGGSNGGRGGGWVENRPARRGLPVLDLREAWRFRDLGMVLAQRTLKVRYKQTLLGIGWALLQPLAGLLIFTLVFGRLAKLPSDGLPYAIFVYPALCLWTYMSTSVSAAAAELVGNPELITKVYFPRILSPAAAVLPPLVDFAIALALAAVLLAAYGIAPGPAVALLPVWVLACAVVAFAVGTWLSAVNVRYRDVRHTLPFLLQTWFFVSPLVFPSTLVDGAWRVVFALNPLVGLIDGLRWSLVGAQPPPLADLASLVSGVLLLAGGLLYFRSVEGRFADVI